MSARIASVFMLSLAFAFVTILSAEAENQIVFEPRACITYSGICGDATGDGIINVSDAVYLIQYVFAGGPPPGEMWRADADLDEMINISDAVFVINYVFAGGPAPCPGGKDPEINYPLPFRDCLEYSYDGAGTVQFRRVNAAFNCCPIMTGMNVNIVGNVITLTELEAPPPEGPCPCLCLSNSEFSVNDLIPGTYTIVVTELYTYPQDEPLEFVVDFTDPVSGSFCAYREHYPWGVN